VNRLTVPFHIMKSTSGVISITGLLLFLPAAPLHHSTSIVAAKKVAIAGEFRELAIDDGVAECVLGPSAEVKGKPGFGWVNKLTPPSYPATLRAVNIGFERGLINTGVKPDSLYRIVVYVDPEGDGPGNQQHPDATFIGRVRGNDQIMTFNLTTPVTIQAGSFVVGAMDDFGIADIPALFDSPGKSNPPGSESFFTQNGGARWQRLSDALPPDPLCSTGSWMIRATVELGAVDPRAVLRIKDPAAVEPWGIGVLNNDVIVTNLVSDNLTIINTVTNSFQTLQLVDPRVCATCGPPLGPYGVAGVRDTNPVAKLYVTLVGSNTIPSKEFPIPYNTVLPGRVVVLQRGANGFVQTGFISVGTGPKFPAVAAGKLYVPCGGANRVDVINTMADLKTGEIPVGADPSSCTASLDGSKIYVTHFGDGSISVIDTKSDKKIKDIAAPLIKFPTPVGSTAPPPAATASLPWNGTVSGANGNLYVTYWGTVGNVSPNGVIAEFDTCKDEFIRALLDDETAGSPPGSAGSTGIPAPTAPLTRDPATGRTLEAGGGGGGPFGLSACLHSPFGNPLDQFSTMVFTNDASGIAGVIDARIDQVVSAPPITVASCSKPRGVVCKTLTSTPPHFAFVACGQPDSSVLVFRVPELTENIVNIPVVQTVEIGDVFRVIGTGFAKFDMRFEVERAGTCLSFKKPARTKQGTTVVLQKGPLSDGSWLTDNVNQNAIIRLIHPDGTARVIPH